MRKGVVVPLPRETGLDEALRGKALKGLDYLQVGNVLELLMGRSIVVLLSDKDTLWKKRSYI